MQRKQKFGASVVLGSSAMILAACNGEAAQAEEQGSSAGDASTEGSTGEGPPIGQGERRHREPDFAVPTSVSPIDGEFADNTVVRVRFDGKVPDVSAVNPEQFRLSIAAYKPTIAKGRYETYTSYVDIGLSDDFYTKGEALNPFIGASIDPEDDTALLLELSAGIDPAYLCYYVNSSYLEDEYDFTDHALLLHFTSSGIDDGAPLRIPDLGADWVLSEYGIMAVYDKDPYPEMSMLVEIACDENMPIVGDIGGTTGATTEAEGTDTDGTDTDGTGGSGTSG